MLFAEVQHPRAADGRFAEKLQSPAGIALRQPLGPEGLSLLLSHVTGCGGRAALS